jgi:hypothetical protein
MSVGQIRVWGTGGRACLALCSPKRHFARRYERSRTHTCLCVLVCVCTLQLNLSKEQREKKEGLEADIEGVKKAIEGEAADPAALQVGHCHCPLPAVRKGGNCRCCSCSCAPAVLSAT